VAQLFVAEAVFSEPKSRATRPGLLLGLCRGAFGADAGRGFGQREQSVLQVALAYGGGPDDEGAVGDGLGECGAGDRVGEDLGGIDGGAGALEGDGEVVDHAQMAQAEVVHGACGCADVVGLRARTRTMWMRSSSSGVGIEFYCNGYGLWAMGYGLKV